MKATELMIRDWVKIGDADKYHGYFGRVRAINSITGYCIIGAMIGEDIFTQTDVFIDDIEPILLTKEIIFANGFESRGYKGELVHKDNRNLKVFYEIDHFEGADWIVKEWGVKGIDGIKFVHEFQHYLRLVGKENLADNFKV